MRAGSIVVVILASSLVPRARAQDGRRANSVLLNGDWEYALGKGDERAETPAGQAGLKGWKRIALPGMFATDANRNRAVRIEFVWARKRFNLSTTRARSLAVLRWNHIVFGAVAFINGRRVGENVPTGPYRVVIPRGVLRPGANTIVLKVAGWAGLARSKSGFPLFPTGASTRGWGNKRPGVRDDVWIDFADGVYMKWILALPDLAARKVRIRVTPDGPKAADNLRISVKIRSWPDGKTAGQGQARARLTPSPDPLAGEHYYVDVPMPRFKPWTHEDPNLYTAEVKLSRRGKILDVAEIRFGMREIRVADGNYKLNGRNLWLRGSNLVSEWNWGDLFKGKEKEYLVTEAREMSMNSFRTHTQPPPRLWANVCDEGGTMILAEMPVLYNNANYHFTPEEYDVWHEHTKSDTAGWMARLWNHPSVVMWVLSNESHYDTPFETGEFRDFVLKLDPTRPTMRTGDRAGTRENYDVHPIGNTSSWTEEGRFIRDVPGWVRRAGSRTVTNTEYMNHGVKPLQWTGRKDRVADALAYAQLGTEHTEAMRRARFDGIWPYMYAGWTRTRRGGQVWKGGFAQPVSACWHSSLSPVLASLELFDAGYLTGQQVTTQLYLINDSWHDAAIHVDLLLTRECPEFIPEAGTFDRPLSKWSFHFQLKADSLRKTPVRWRLPEEEGSYWLTARTTGLEGRAVLSQRFVRAVRPPEISGALKRRVFVILGSGPAGEAYFRKKGLATTGRTDDLKPGRNVVIVWNASRLTAAEKRSAASLCAFAAAGGRVVVLSTRRWDWKELCDVEIGKTRGSRAFAHQDVRHPLLAGIEPEWLKRWNGLPGTVVVADIKGPAMKDAKRILWVYRPQNTAAAEIPAATGQGRILFSQLDIQRRVDGAKPAYDPVAERVLVNILGM